MSRLLAILFTFTALASSVLAFPNTPGTCLVSGMKGTPHGDTPTKTVTVTTDVKLMSAGTYSITLTGTDSITGLLLYAVDSNGVRFGSFAKPPAGFGPKTGCAGTNPASNTLGHTTATPKTLPLTFTWSDGGYLAKTNLTTSFAGVAMSKAEAVWYVLAGQIPSANGTSPSGASSSGAAAAASSVGTTIPSTASVSASAGGANVNASSGANKTNTDVYSYGASSSSTIQVYWSLVVVGLLTLFATFLQ